MERLEALLREAFVTHGITAVNLFLNGDSGFQANVSHRPSEQYRIGRDADPVAALTSALGAAVRMRKSKVSPAGQFEDLLG